jgi:hypothetical protein
MGHLSSTVTNLYIAKKERKEKKEIDLHRTQQGCSLQFSASGPVQGKTIETPTPPQTPVCNHPPTHNQHPVSLENLPGRVLYK